MDLKSRKELYHLRKDDLRKQHKHLANISGGNSVLLNVEIAEICTEELTHSTTVHKDSLIFGAELKTYQSVLGKLLKTDRHGILNLLLSQSEVLGFTKEEIFPGFVECFFSGESHFDKHVVELIGSVNNEKALQLSWEEFPKLDFLSANSCSKLEGNPLVERHLGSEARQQAPCCINVASDCSTVCMLIDHLQASWPDKPLLFCFVSLGSIETTHHCLLKILDGLNRTVSEDEVSLSLVVYWLSKAKEQSTVVLLFDDFNLPPDISTQILDTLFAISLSVPECYVILSIADMTWSRDSIPSTNYRDCQSFQRRKFLLEREFLGTSGQDNMRDKLVLQSIGDLALSRIEKDAKPQGSGWDKVSNFYEKFQGWFEYVGYDLAKSIVALVSILGGTSSSLVLANLLRIPVIKAYTLLKHLTSLGLLFSPSPFHNNKQMSQWKSRIFLVNSFVMTACYDLMKQQSGNSGNKFYSLLNLIFLKVIPEASFDYSQPVREPVCRYEFDPCISTAACRGLYRAIWEMFQNNRCLYILAHDPQSISFFHCLWEEVIAKRDLQQLYVAFAELTGPCHDVTVSKSWKIYGWCMSSLVSPSRFEKMYFLDFAEALCDNLKTSHGVEGMIAESSFIYYAKGTMHLMLFQSHGQILSLHTALENLQKYARFVEEANASPRKKFDGFFSAGKVCSLLDQISVVEVSKRYALMALQYFRDCLKIIEINRKTQGEFACFSRTRHLEPLVLHELAVIQLSLDNKKDAFQNARKSSNLLKEYQLQGSSACFNVYMGVAKVLGELEQYDEALNLTEKCLPLCKSLSIAVYKKACVIFQIAGLYFKSTSTKVDTKEKSMDHYELALKLCRKESVKSNQLEKLELAIEHDFEAMLQSEYTNNGISQSIFDAKMHFLHQKRVSDYSSSRYRDTETNVGQERSSAKQKNIPMQASGASDDEYEPLLPEISLQINPAKTLNPIEAVPSKPMHSYVYGSFLVCFDPELADKITLRTMTFIGGHNAKLLDVMETAISEMLTVSSGEGNELPPRSFIIGYFLPVSDSSLAFSLKAVGTDTLGSCCLVSSEHYFPSEKPKENEKNKLVAYSIDSVGSYVFVKTKKPVVKQVDTSLSSQIVEIKTDDYEFSLDFPRDCAKPFELKAQVSHAKDFIKHAISDMKLASSPLIELQGWEDFKSPVIITIPLPDYPTRYGVVIVRRKDEAKWEFLDESVMFHVDGKSVSFKANHFSQFAVVFQGMTLIGVSYALSWAAIRISQFISNEFYVPFYILWEKQLDWNLWKYKVACTCGGYTIPKRELKGFNKIAGCSSQFPVLEGDVLKITLSSDLKTYCEEEYSILFSAKLKYMVQEFHVKKVDHSCSISAVLIHPPDLCRSEVKQRLEINHERELEDFQKTFLKMKVENFDFAYLADEGQSHPPDIELKFIEWKIQHECDLNHTDCVLGFLSDLLLDIDLTTDGDEEEMLRVCRAFDRDPPNDEIVRVVQFVLLSLRECDWTGKLFQWIAKSTGDHWQKLGHVLGLVKAELQNIYHDRHQEQREVAIGVMEKWIEKEEGCCTILELIKRINRLEVEQSRYQMINQIGVFYHENVAN